MNINTVEIKNTIERVLNKKIINVSVNDLEKIDTLYISRFSIDGVLNIVDFNDLKYFSMLKYLTIKKCTLNREDIYTISKLNNLDSLSLIDCEFSEDCEEHFRNIKINSLSLNNVKNFNYNWLHNLNSLVLWNMTIIPLSISVNTLNLIYSNFEENILKNLSISKLIISESQYNRNTEFYNILKYKVLVLEERSMSIVCEAGALC